MTTYATAAADVREAFGVELYVERPELHPSGPRLLGRDDGGPVLSCPCGDHHAAVVTAYGYRAQCDELAVRWSSLDVDTREAGPLNIRSWTAEPYGTMSTRSTRNEEARK